MMAFVGGYDDDDDDGDENGDDDGDRDSYDDGDDDIDDDDLSVGVAVRDSFCSSDSCTCASDNECSVSKPVCECPCTSSMQFQHCRFQFPNSRLAFLNTSIL